MADPDKNSRNLEAQILSLEKKIQSLEAERDALSHRIGVPFLHTEAAGAFRLVAILIFVALGVQVFTIRSGSVSPFSGVFAWLFFGVIGLVVIAWLIQLAMIVGRRFTVNAQISQQKAQLKAAVSELRKNGET